MSFILIVDDELSMREFLKILLEKDGHTVEMASDASSGLKLAADNEFDLVISDIRMPGLSGLEMLAELKKNQPDLPVIMITAFASPEDAVNAMKNGAFDYITKPFKVDEIKQVIKSATTRKATEQDIPPTELFHDIIGQSPEMIRIFDLIKRIAPTPANVLIYGESGTGKELVAQAIHRYSRVADEAFVPITCSAIPESLLESELFGHVKGSFTGAIANKDGLFQQADRGTAFLDEIGELTPIIQTKLLRFLQEREFMPVGSTKTKKVNVRIIAATNRNLEKEIVAGNFREDLYYRLAVVPIRVPPLRERKGDVPLLVNHFLEKYSRLLDKDIQTISSYGLKVLMEYDFPGNVRELENIIERGVALESSNIILPESLELSTHRQLQQQDSHHAGHDQIRAPLFIAAEDEDELYERGMEDVLTSLEKEIISHTLAKAGNSKMRAAELLKVSFRSLRYKTKKYGLD
ncbi:MAG TPA: sigma-54-dependent Fis family transcriptional regulator [Desulfobacteraceae bacterium]|nr:sigma-54-dependent Fis family transcriptional regulator [Desulfobacteraceae bacterium]